LAKFTKTISNGDPLQLTGKTGTRRYMSPEVATSMSYGTPSDIFSLGATLYAAYAGEMPFAEHDLALHEQWMVAARDPSETADFLEQGFPSAWGMPKPVREFLLRMVHPRPETRPEALTVVEFFRDLPTKKGTGSKQCTVM